MPNLNVTVLGSLGYSRDYGKKGTESDVTLYNMKRGLTTVTFIEPSKYPEKLASLFYSASFSDFAILVVDTVNAALGESILMLDCVGLKKGLVVPRNYIGIDQVKKLINGTVVEKYLFMDDDPPKIRDYLNSLAEERSTTVKSDKGTVIVDHYFNVRGVGVVALGVVKDGQIHIHDKLKALPLGVIAQVRSIQKHDDDFQTAEIGDRVGLALKGIEVENLERGMVLTNDDSYIVSNRVKGSLRKVRYWVNPLLEGLTMHIGIGMQFLPSKLASLKNNDISIELEKSVVYKHGDIATLAYLNAGNLRIIGTVTL